MEKNVLEKIKEQKDNFRDSEEKVANYIFSSLARCPSSSNN